MDSLKRVELDDGQFVVIDVDYDVWTLEELSSGDLARVMAAFAAVIVETNLTDRKGQPIEISPAGLKRLRVSQLNRIQQALTEGQALPLESAAS